MGVLAAAFGSELLGTALTAFFNALFGTLFSFLDQQDRDREHEQAGADRVTVAVTKESADAERRAETVVVNAPDVGGVLADMERGDF